MRTLSPFAIMFLALLLNPGCNSPKPVITDEADYMKSMKVWQENRLERLKGDRGWLNLAGLFWLNEGENSFGSDPGNDIVFPEKADAFCGTLMLEQGKVMLTVADGVEILSEQTPVKEMILENDQVKNTTHLKQGDLTWYILKRGDRYGIRLRDLQHPRISQLDHIPSYPVRTSYVVEAVMHPFDSAKTISVATPVEAYTEDYQCPGILHFRLQGKDLQIHPFTSGKGYFLIIADETTGLDTYGAGRFMYAEPDSVGQIILDFNKATNPPCAFSPFATCPMPPRENFLPIAIEAGEKSVHLN